MLTSAWFVDAMRPYMVMAQLARSIPEFADGRLVLLNCRVSRIRSLAPDGCWTAVYELDLRDVRTSLEQTFTAQGLLTPPRHALPASSEEMPFGTEGWSVVIPNLRLQLRAVPFDDALPALALITDPEQARLLLQETLGDTGRLGDGSTIASCVPTVLAHKSGVRAAVLCRLEYVGDRPRGPGAVVVKVHHDNQGERAHVAMLALSAAMRSTGTVRLAQPLSYRPDLKLSVQEYVDHRWSLKELFHTALSGGDSDVWAELLDAIRATAAGLAELHQCGTHVGVPATWGDELATVRTKLDRLTSVMPTLRGWTAVGNRLEAAAATTIADPLGPAHHSFHPSQVLVTDRGIGFIDFDKFCQAEPASDIALFTAKLMHMAVNKIVTQYPGEIREDQVAELRSNFVDEYRRHAPISLDRVALWEALELASQVLSAVKKVNTAWINNCQRMLEERLEANGW